RFRLIDPDYLELPVEHLDRITYFEFAVVLLNSIDYCFVVRGGRVTLDGSRVGDFCERIQIHSVDHLEGLERLTTRHHRRNAVNRPNLFGEVYLQIQRRAQVQHKRVSGRAKHDFSGERGVALALVVEKTVADADSQNDEDDSQSDSCDGCDGSSLAVE